jgi:hypothetical protein
VKIRFDKIGYPLYCDIGPNEGDMRVALAISLYLSPQEYAGYEGPESLRITLGEPGSEPARVGGTAGPPGDRPAAPGEPASTAKEHSNGRP